MWSLIVTQIKVGSWVRSLDVVVLWAVDTDREVITGSRFPFNPSGYTTQSLHCKR